MVNTQDFQDFKSMKSVEHCAAVAQKCCRAIYLHFYLYQFSNCQAIRYSLLSRSCDRSVICPGLPQLV